MQGGEDADYMGDLSQFVQPCDMLSVQIGQTREEGQGDRGNLNWKVRGKLRKKEQQKLEDEQVRKGFESAIPSTNIGYKMLQQMGYNPGGALGKHGQGRLEPVNVEIKRQRTGLGRDCVVQQEKNRRLKETERVDNEMKREREILFSDFGEKKKTLWRSRKILDDYRKARNALIQLEPAYLGPNGGAEKGKRLKLEMEETISEKKRRRKKNKEKTEEDEEEEEVTAEQLQEILDRLRMEFCYCLYCGCQYESANAMLSHCPGPEEEDH